MAWRWSTRCLLESNTQREVGDVCSNARQTRTDQPALPLRGVRHARAAFRARIGSLLGLSSAPVGLGRACQTADLMRWQGRACQTADLMRWQGRACQTADLM